MEFINNKFIFICGCARSGTSITTELLRRHSKIGMGRERYNSLFKTNKYNFNQNIFNKHRFCKELLDGDTHHNKLGEYYDHLFPLWNQCEYFGDKIPSLFKAYDYLLDAFPKPKILFLLRNIIDVSQSWEKRRIRAAQTNGKWPHNRGFAEAITEWNQSLRNTIAALSKHDDTIFVVPYEKLFSDRDLLKNIFEFLDLDISEEVENFWNKSTLKKNRLEKNRTITMPTAIKNQICMHADFESYRYLKLRSNL